MSAAVGAGSVQFRNTVGRCSTSQTHRQAQDARDWASGERRSGAGCIDPYFDRWQNLNATGQSLSIASGVFGAVGIALLVPGAALLKAK